MDSHRENSPAIYGGVVQSKCKVPSGTKEKDGGCAPVPFVPAGLEWILGEEPTAEALGYFHSQWAGEESEGAS